MTTAHLTPARAREIIQACEFRNLLDYNPTTGDLVWRLRPTEGLGELAAFRVSMWNARWAGTVAGALGPAGYIRVGAFGKLHQSHRLAWLLMTTRWPTKQIDHINGRKSDNRWANLRNVTVSENSRNKRMSRGNASGFLGVSHHGKRFRALICVEQKQIYLGMFANPEEAHAAYRAAAQEFGFGPAHGHTAEAPALRG